MKTLEQIEAMAKDAIPTTSDDWGSERQIKAENDFFDAVKEHLTDDEYADFQASCLKATAEEAVDSGLLRVRAAVMTLALRSPSREAILARCDDDIWVKY